MFICKLCNKTFKRNYDLKRHSLKKISCVKIIEEHKCTQCNKKYSTASSLKRHTLTVCYSPIDRLNDFLSKKIIIKESQNELECSYCNKNFTRKDNLSRHLEKYCKIKKEILIDREKKYQKLKLLIEVDNKN